MADVFKPGDVVQLKSGGPRMTVSAVDQGEKKIDCQWFAGAKREFGSFDFEIVVKVLKDETKRE